MGKVINFADAKKRIKRKEKLGNRKRFAPTMIIIISLLIIILVTVTVFFEDKATSFRENTIYTRTGMSVY
ncbi:hypothetical protein [Caldisalinibacter kiritimatiensis]|uniref:Uncharacterized protein n=1 Tax=Caldisalinibacter kiritimatiensis TaxID=1304284 RepID=R1CET9_9FIRM|nr:hypothetical protein [Caldisalinibacter kiritimatiensis]EOD00825.1 hypothetical protein L21TH_1101 [Caldisalinibacter kiritimatiensis]